jgi:flagellar basal-body rod protein FlgB
MTDKLDDMLRFHQSALNLRAYRQQLLAGNIANADTPNFKARDIDFSSALQSALSSRPGNSGLTTTSPRHLLGAAADIPTGAQALYRTPLQPSLDRNTVEMDVERTQFADNAIHYEANLTFISSQIKTMLAAIQSQ